MLKLLPGQRLIYLLTVTLALFVTMGVTSFFIPANWDLWYFSIGLIITMVLCLDGIRLWWLNRKIIIDFNRDLPVHFVVNQSTLVTLNVRHNGKKSIQLSIFDHFPDTFFESDKVFSPMPLNVTIESGEYAQLVYSVKPGRRGKGLFVGTQVRLSSAWKLWQMEQFIEKKETVKVYPDFRRITAENLDSGTSQQQGNQAQHRQRGNGTDFSQLREYRVGDALNQIDYKATARMNKLISKEFQLERDQQVMILLDCSRRLRLFQSGLSHFDYALNTSIYLARTILNQGDAVGLMSFGNTDVQYSKPRKGRQSVNQLLNQVYDLEASRQAPDYALAAESLMARQKRRSLVIIVTSLQEEDTDAVKSMLKTLQKRHIVLIANLKPELLDEPVEINQIDDAVYYAARETYNKQRDEMLQKIKNKQLILLDSYPKALTTKLINTYLNIKQSGMF